MKLSDRTHARGLFTKPLQGSLFRKFRDVILGFSHMDTLERESPPLDEERGGQERPERPGGKGIAHELPVTKGVTWAEVVRGASTQHREKTVDVSIYLILSKQST